MTRINTNVSSLNAQKTLARSNAQLQESLTRLSTGLRINSGKDDPAGLIASETLRADIVSTQVAITNSERANQMIATADSALGQVSSLLNDIRGLVSEAANEGAISVEQIKANQLQVDSSLEAIDRIAQVTQFQGKRLLDGSLDFITEGVDASSISNLQIDQANFGTQTEIAVSVDVVAQAEKASLSYTSSTISENVVLKIGGSSGYEAFNFAADSTIAEMEAAINLVSDALGVTAEVDYNTATEDGTGATILTSFGDDNDIAVTAVDAGRAGGDIAIVYQVTEGAGDTTAASATNGDGTEVITVTLDATEWAQATDTATIDGVVGTLTAVNSGEAWNSANLGGDVTISISSVTGTKGATWNSTTRTIDVTLTAGSITHADVTAAIADSDVGRLFTFTSATPGTTATVADTAFTLISGDDGGEILSTAADVISALNDDVGDLVSADNATGNDGTGDVTMFTEYANYGTLNVGSDNDADNALQFLGPDGSTDLNFRFVASEANQDLSVELDANTVTNGYAETVVQGDAENSSFVVRAKNKGNAYNDVTVVFTQDDNADTAWATWDPSAGTDGVIEITADFTANNYTAQDMIDTINDDEYVGALFEAEAFGSLATGQRQRDDDHGGPWARCPAATSTPA